MRKLFETIGNLIGNAIDFFYPPFRKYVTPHFFRYGITGGANLVFDWVLYFFIYNFVLHQQMLNLGIVTLSSHIATLAFKFPIVLISGFMLQKYVTFANSEIRGRIQLYRYFIVVLLNLTVNYVGLKILVDGFSFYPTPSNMVISILCVFISYYSQKLYTFKIQAEANKKIS